MSSPPQSLIPLLIPPVEGEGLVFSQGTILTWDPTDNTGTIDWRGVTLSNVPVLSGIQALGFQAGHVVGLIGWNPGGGVGSWWIVGRILRPGVDSPDLVVRGSDIVVDGGRLIIEGGGSQIIRDSGGLTIAGGGDLVVDGGDIDVQTGSVNIDGTLDVGGPTTIDGPTTLDSQLTVNGSIVADDSGNDRRAEVRPGLLAVSNSSGGSEGEIRHNPNDDGMYVSAPGALICESRGSFASLTTDGGASVTAQSTGVVNIFSSANNVTVDHVTTSNSANCNITLTGRLRRETSARKYKQDIADFHASSKTILDLKPRTWRDRNEVAEDPDTDHWHVGLIAEEVDEAGLTGLVDYDHEGNPDSVAYNRLAVALLDVVRHQDRRIAALEAQLSVTPPADPETTPLPKRRSAAPA